MVRRRVRFEGRHQRRQAIRRLNRPWRGIPGMAMTLQRTSSAARMPMGGSTMDRHTEGLAIRLTSDQKRALVAAADTQHLSLNEFVRQSALRQAVEVLPDRQTFLLCRRLGSLHGRPERSTARPAAAASASRRTERVQPSRPPKLRRSAGASAQRSRPPKKSANSWRGSQRRSRRASSRPGARQKRSLTASMTSRSPTKPR